ncbi:MAG: RNase H family protein [Acidobacteriota bacterium]|nr:hypothetical protein [Blastocatellia bacterium]MDW8411542.1 RNase H family protein [Acidobacteriota bacterium]
MKKQVILVCDGCSLDNSSYASGISRAAAAAIIEYNGKHKIVGEYLGNASNQQAEIVAACIGLENLCEPCNVTVLSDSQYLIKTMRGEFKRKANKDFWARLDRAANGHTIEWSWTKGHAGHELQEKCDRAANLIARMGFVDQAALNRILNEPVAKPVYTSEDKS